MTVAMQDNWRCPMGTHSVRSIMPCPLFRDLSEAAAHTGVRAAAAIRASMMGNRDLSSKALQKTGLTLPEVPVPAWEPSPGTSRGPGRPAMTRIHVHRDRDDSARQRTPPPAAAAVAPLPSRHVTAQSR